MIRKRTINESIEQLSIFDIELPPNYINTLDHIENNIPNPSENNSTNKPPIPIYKAKVPDEEFIYQDRIGNIPTVNEMLKMLDKGLYKVNAHEFLADVFECSAIAISNRFDIPQAEEREKRYLQIIKKYEPDMQKLITELFAKMFSLLTQQINSAVGFNDYLGELYMRSETSNSKTGQFFTPYCVSKMCAEAAINEDAINEHITQDKILTLSEPACGAGGMVLAAADILYNKYHFNISRNLLVECSDIDSRCVHMSYLQLGLAGIPAVIYKRDTLSLQTWERWETPAYIMQWLRFKDA